MPVLSFWFVTEFDSMFASKCVRFVVGGLKPAFIRLLGLRFFLFKHLLMAFNVYLVGVWLLNVLYAVFLSLCILYRMYFLLTARLTFIVWYQFPVSCEVWLSSRHSADLSIKILSDLPTILQHPMHWGISHFVKVLSQVSTVYMVIDWSGIIWRWRLIRKFKWCRKVELKHAKRFY